MKPEYIVGGIVAVLVIAGLAALFVLSPSKAENEGTYDAKNRKT